MAGNTSHLMKTTRRGRPYVKDTHDLFATLVVSLPLDSHRNFFKSYPNSFTTDEAANNLSALKFSQSTRASDPKDPARIVTTTTTTTFSMSREMAKGICQHFMDAHLIENAADLSTTMFKERGIYMMTPKGLHILERFISKNGINAEQLMRMFAIQPICMKLLHLERRSADDEIIVTKSVIEVLWRRFAGREPNVTRLNEEDLAAQWHSRYYNKSVVPKGGEEVDFAVGIIVRKHAGLDKKVGAADEFHFAALSAIEWLLDYTTCVGPDEAAEMGAQFVRYGLIALVSDKGKVRDNNLVMTVKGGEAGGSAGVVTQEGEFRATEKGIYKITKEGMVCAKWIEAAKQQLNTSAGTTKAPLVRKESAPSVRAPRASPALDDVRSRPDVFRTSSLPDSPDVASDKDQHAKDSHTARLKHILDEPALRSLFREFLRQNFCEENLSFWLDVQDFKRRFATTSSAVANPVLAGKARTQGHQAMEKHQQDLIAMAFVIYNTYLAAASPCELNIDHNLRAELISYMNSITTDKEAAAKGNMDPGTSSTVAASQLQTMVRMYERIQTYIFRLMATDSVPKFCKTERFLGLMRTVFDYNEKMAENDTSDLRQHIGHLTISGKGGLGMEDHQASPTRTFLTISQAANERQAMQASNRELANGRYQF